MEQVSLKLHLFRSYLWSKTASLLIGFALFFYNSGVLYSTLEKAMATHSRILAWRIPGTEEPGGLPCMGLHRVGHDWSDLAAAAAAAAFYGRENDLASLVDPLGTYAAGEQYVVLSKGM